MAIWSELKMTEMMGMDFQHQSPEYLRFWSLYFQFLRISPFISIYCWVYRWILISCWFLRSSTFQQYTVPDFLLPSRSTERPQAIAITTEFEISKAKTIRKAAGMSKPCCRSCLEISIWSFNWQLKRLCGFFDEFWLMIFSHSTTRLNQACVFWACRWIVMDR